MFDPSKKTILIVDDTPENVDILRALLSEYNQLIAINGKIALKIANLIPAPDLILLDVMMPELNGFQVCEELKKNAKTRDIPVLFITALTEVKNLVKSFEVGGVDYITKPFNPSEVKKRVETHLALRSYQQKLESMNSELEQKVQERTIELQKVNDELVVAKNKAEDINKLKSFFIQNISHELRTPLIAILGFSELIAAESDNPDHAEYCGRIFESGQRLQKTLNDIISLTDLENKKLELTLRHFDIVPVINKSLSIFGPTAKQKGLEYNILFELEELFITTDESLLTYLLFHLVDNAIKFTEKGSVKVQFSKLHENSSDYLQIIIADTGIGISKEKLEVIFAAFRQESEGYSRKYEGMGIGLTIARELIAILRGKLYISSQRKSGTKIRIKLPLKASTEQINLKIKEAKKYIDENHSEKYASKPKLLMVEDNENNRLLLKKILEDDFYVEEAKDGITSVAMAEMKKYDLILMDINLGPGIDGIEALNRIRTFSNYKDVPIIAVTAYANKEDRDKYLAYGFDDFIQKPILKNDFLLFIKAHLDYSV